jgi:hypothetical protein
MPATPSTTSRGPKRSAAQMKSGKTTYSSERMAAWLENGASNTTEVTASSAPPNAASSTARARVRRVPGRTEQTRRMGATSSAPIASPTHQTSHVPWNVADCGSRPATATVVTPRVALSTGLAAAARSSATTSRRRSKRNDAPPTARRIAAPATASRVFPIAIPAATSGASSLCQLARNAPAATPGQSRDPKRRRTASAMPVGGQTGDACRTVDARCRPSQAEAQ